MAAAVVLVDVSFVRSLSPLPRSEERRASSALPVLIGLRGQIHDRDRLERMQRLFPEGACFTVTLYALAWTNLAVDAALPASTRSAALAEARWALDQYECPPVVSPFMSTQVRNGIFWLGQRNLVLAQLLRASPPGERPQALAEEFHANAAAMAEAFLDSPTAHLDSYPGMCWPADNVTALASLLVHDEMYATSYRAAYEKWKAWITSHPDPRTGLPAGRIDSATGELLEPARGCACSWILSLLPAMDMALSERLYRLYVDQFRVDRFGFAMFREYPRGVDLEADVDSGPIVLGVGVTATGVALATAIANGDLRTAQDVHGLATALGCRRSLRGSGGAEYLFGKVPVGDAFLAWGYSFPDLHRAGPSDSPSHPLARPARLLAAGMLIAVNGVAVTLARRLLHALPGLSA